MDASDQIAGEDYIPFLSKQTDSDSNFYELLANYRDPFKSGLTQEEGTGNSGSSRRSNIQNPIVQQRFIYWPDIEYNGMILNNQKQVALIRINGANQLMKENEERQQIKVIRIYADSVRLAYQGESKVIGKIKK
jgi:hypothetical protein